MSRKSFSERMAEGKAIAQELRNKGQSTSVHSSWRVPKAKLEGLDALENYLKEWRKDQSYYAHLAVEMALFPQDFVEF